MYNCEKAFCAFLLPAIVIPGLAVGPDTPGVVNDRGGHWSKSDIYDLSSKHPPLQSTWWPREQIIFSLCCYHSLQPAKQLKSRPCKSHLICPTLLWQPHQIQQNSAAKKVGAGAKKLEASKGLLCRRLKGRSHLICGSLQTTSNATSASTTRHPTPCNTRCTASIVHNLTPWVGLQKKLQQILQSGTPGFK